MLVFRAGIHKILVRIANREDPDQTASKKTLNMTNGAIVALKFGHSWAL